MIAVLVPLIVLGAAPAPGRLDLEGRIVAKGGGPVAGAHVVIDSAAARQGTSPLCPSCHADCRKGSQTDPDGRFRILSVDSELVFNLLVVADGFRTTLTRRSDPKKGPVEVKLEPFDPARLDPKCVLRGVVLGPGGQRLAGARLTPLSFRTESFSGFSPDIFDPVAVTDLRGEFVLTSNSPIEYADLRVEGAGAAPAVVAARKPAANPQQIRMTAGATLTGRVVRDGKPVPGAVLGLVQIDRSMDKFLGSQSIGTGADGRFTFLNVHADEEYTLYGLMGRLQGDALAARRVKVGREGATIDIGDLPATRGHRVKGRLILSDGKPIPGKSHLLISREDAWDTQEVSIDPDGHFELAGLPTERYSVYITVKGYRLAPRNHSVDAQRPGVLTGTVDQDIDPLKILLEPRLPD